MGILEEGCVCETLETTGMAAAGVWARNGEKQMVNEEKK